MDGYKTLDTVLHWLALHLVGKGDRGKNLDYHLTEQKINSRLIRLDSKCFIIFKVLDYKNKRSLQFVVNRAFSSKTRYKTQKPEVKISVE